MHRISSASSSPGYAGSVSHLRGRNRSRPLGAAGKAAGASLWALPLVLSSWEVTVFRPSTGTAAGQSSDAHGPSWTWSEHRIDLIGMVWN